MSDYNQLNQLNLPGFEEYPDMSTSVMPDFNQLLVNKVQTIKSGFDPHQIMIQKKQVQSGEDNIPNQTWPDKDIKILEDFCAKHGIFGFNCGKMSPIAAMAMLKQKIGIGDGPLEERVPVGYEKLGRFNSSYPYTAMVKEKTLLTDNNTDKKSLING